MIRYLAILATVWFGGCSKEPSRPLSSEPKTNYANRLSETKSMFRFQHWPAHARPAVAAVFEQLLLDLIAAGESASETQKIDCFTRAAVALNEINRRDLTVIETGEAEQLIDLGNQIAKAASLDPRKYGNGEGPLSAGRDW